MGWWARVFGPLRPVFLRPALPLAAIACLVLVAGFIIDDPARIAMPSVENPQIREVEQLERTLDDLDMLRQFNLTLPVKEDDSRS